MKKRNLLLVILAVLLVLGMVIGCGDLPEGDGTGTTPGGGNKTVSFSGITVDGSTTQATMKLKLAFSGAITDLAKEDITLGGVAGVAIDSLNGTASPYTLTISNFSAGGTLSVTVAKTGYNITGNGKTVVIKSAAAVAADFYADYVATYGTSSNPTTEHVKISAGKIEVYELKGSTTTKDDFIDFTINKWEFGGETGVTLPTGYTVAFKLTGTLTDAKPKDGTKIYGRKTAPGLKQTDLNKPTYVYLYFDVSDPIDTDLQRSPYSLDGISKDENGQTTYKFVTGDDDAVRIYTSL